MAKSVNKVIIVGSLGKDPEVKYTNSGTACANITVATDESYKDKSSQEWKTKTEWHNIVLWARTAEVAGEFLKKGSKVYIEGRLQTRQWEDKQGNKRYTTEIVANDLVLLGESGKRTAEPEPAKQEITDDDLPDFMRDSPKDEAPF